MLPGELPKPKRWRLRGRRAGRGCILPHTACDRKPTHTARPRQCALWLPLHLPAARTAVRSESAALLVPYNWLPGGSDNRLGLYIRRDYIGSGYIGSVAGFGPGLPLIL